MTGRETATQDQRLSESEILSELHRTLTETTGSFTEKVEALLAVGQTHLSMDAGVVASVDGDRYEVELLYTDCDRLADLSVGTALPLSETICERTLADGATYALDDIPAEAPELADRAAVTEFDGKRYLGTPLVVNDEPYGTLCFYGTERHAQALDDYDRTLIAFMSQLISYELEHQLDQAQLRATNTELERYEQILDTVPDGVYALDEHERFTYANKGLAELTGFDREELVGSHIGLFKNRETVEAARSAVSEEIHRVIDGEGTGEIEIDLTVERADGQQLACQDHIALLPFDEEFRGSVGTIRDITAQLERERTLSGLLDMTRGLMVAETPHAVADTIVETVESVIGFDRAVVRLYDDETDQLVPVSVSTAVEMNTDNAVAPVAVGEEAAGEGAVGEAFATGEPSRAESTPHTVGDDSLAVFPIGSHGTLSIALDDEDSDRSVHQLLALLTANAEAAFDRTDRQQVLRRYEMIVETVQEMLCILDSDGQFQLVTEPLADFVGIPREKLLGASAIELFGGEAADSVAADIRSLLADDETTQLSVETVTETADHGTVPVQIEASQLRQADDAELIISVHDRSELVSAKQAVAAERERFSYLFENLTDPINEIEHADGQLESSTHNRAFSRLFGEPAVGERTQLDDTKPLAVEDDRIVGADESEAAHGDRELKIRTAEGVHYFLYRRVPYELDDTHRQFEIYTDVTALKTREIQLQVLHRLLRHNLRNDLNVVAGFAELLAEEADTDTHAEFAERIVANVTDLIDLSETARRIESVAGRQSLDREPIAVEQLARSIAGRYQAEYPEVSVSVDCEKGVVSAGPHLQSAIEALLENGIEHNTADEPRVAIHTRRTDTTVRITVRDNGDGVPDHEWAVVTGDSEISQLEHGSGLGLWLVRWITEAYGGTLTRETELDGGAVSIRLPVASDDQ